jgi:hypothetical protein
MHTVRSNKGIHKRKDARDLSFLTDLRPSRGVVPCHWLVGVTSPRTMAKHSSQSHGQDSWPFLLPHHTGWIDAVNVRAWSQLPVSGALSGLDGEEAKAPSTPCTILGVGSK